MSDLSFEYRILQNPALGAFLIWSFTQSYTTSRKDGAAPPLQLAYLVLPICLYPDISKPISSTFIKSGLRAAVEKYSSVEVGRDLLVEIQNRCERLKQLSRQSIAVGITASALTLDPANAALVALPNASWPRVGSRIEKMSRSAVKLGAWFSQLTLYEISATLQVAL